MAKFSVVVYRKILNYLK